MAKQPVWKIGFSNEFNYGQHIALKQGLAKALQDYFPGTEVGITIKEGERDGFYVSGSRDAAEHVAVLLSKRAMNYFTRNVAFGVASYEAPQESTGAIDEDLISTIEEGVRIVYNASVEDLSSRIGELLSENSRLKSQQGEMPGKPETVDNLVSILSMEVADDASWYNEIFEKVSIEDIELSGKKPSELGHEAAGNAAGERGIKGWMELLMMKDGPYEESGECVVPPDVYRKAKSDRDALLNVITSAPENVKGLLESSLKAELERMQKAVDEYEAAQLEYMKKGADSLFLKKAYSHAEAEQKERIARVEPVREFVETVSGTEIPVVLKRSGSCVYVHVGGFVKGSPFSSEMSDIISRSAKGYSVKQDSGDNGIARYAVHCADPAQAERDVYNRLLSLESNMGKLGMRIRVVQLP